MALLEVSDLHAHYGAIEALKPVIGENGNNADALSLMGFALRKSGDVKHALGFYRRALSVNPNHRGANEYLGQLYLDGMPAETISQQGDNRLVSQTMSVDAVDQFQVLSSTPPAEYMGAGAENFTMKSGGLQYHGQASDFVRNTAFDAWSFTNKFATTKNAAGATIPATS